MSNEEKGTGALKMPSEKSLESIAWQTWPPEFLKPFASEHQLVGGRVSAEELYIKSKFSDFAEKPTSLVTAVQDQSRICGGNKDQGHRAGTTKRPHLGRYKPCPAPFGPLREIFTRFALSTREACLPPSFPFILSFLYSLRCS